jgi:hypothetical protein
MNRPAVHASVIGNCATWHCACGNPIALQGKSGPSTGPTRESAVVCDQCARVFFVIPLDRSFGPPVEVVELFALPESSPTTSPSNFEQPSETTSTSPASSSGHTSMDDSPAAKSVRATPESNLTASESGP